MDARDRTAACRFGISSVRQGSQGFADGSHIEKRPDLTLYLTSRNPNFPLVVECKIIDRRTRKGVDLYCEEGLRRFIDGEYAWTNSEAVMLAYVRDQSSRSLRFRPLGQRLLPIARIGGWPASDCSPGGATSC